MAMCIVDTTIAKKTRWHYFSLDKWKAQCYT